MKHFLLIPFFVLYINLTLAQEKISFMAEDGLPVTADLYQINPSKPFILLFHQAGYSRGEYKNIAKKIVKFGYNCLAVDLRSGGEINYIQNHTALVAVQKGYSTDYLSSQKDIEAAIKWVKQRSDKPIILFGSSFSASLSLLIAKDNPDIGAVIAFSPGEFFIPDISIKSELKDFQKPVFVASSRREEPYIKEMFSFVPSSNKTIFAPEKGPGEHGSKSLWNSNPTSKEYWLALTMFFSKIR